MTGISKESFTGYIKGLRFKDMFNELGWDHETKEETVTINEEQYKYNIVASLHGFYVLTLKFGEKLIPQNKIRRTIASKLSSTFPNSLFIFFSEQTQYWSYMIKRENLSDRYTETAFSIGQEADALFQRAAGLFFEIDEMDRINFIDVNARVKKGFQVNYDTITKKFYDYFKKEHTAFKAAITGITQETDLDWYASVTLNRLMFCYFIQKKGFLSEDRDYLSNRLKYFIANKDQTGFFSFYKEFLIVLFHKGLGSQERDIKLQELLGNIPYLNGGMFEVHELESKYADIDISNDAFQKIFNFFDQYNWHLDISPKAPGNEINPDVLGYIFEKYINQRAEMGAYYTKEDITSYIGKNTILPFLFDEVKRHYTAPFQDGGEIWQFMKQSGDNYIYPAIKYGIADKIKEECDWDNLFSDLPEEVQTGLDTEQKDLWIIRKPWNKPAPPDIALPTEIYREVIDRRYRYKELRSKIDLGEVREINDLITYNLDIINFTQDVLENTQDPKLVEHFYKAVQKVTVLDPTCGSGAFLFAAMNILEPLYEILIERMRSMVHDEDRSNSDNYLKGRSVYTDKFRFFREVLYNIIGVKDTDDPNPKRKHPNQKYFIFKSIILNNLFGVDIMKEAVEIAKLRLFLKLVAQVHPDKNDENLGIEPLPDMDFDIKCGNTLVGFATKSELENVSSLLLDEKLKTQIYDECEKISMSFDAFKEEQLKGGDSTLIKNELKERIAELNENLNLLLYKAHYGGGDYEQWKTSHQPFHWFAEFYEILDKNGGFDVIIGNPPYVENTKAFKKYKVVGYKSTPSGNIYSLVIERGYSILCINGSKGWIVPISVLSTDRTKSLQSIILQADIKYSATFDVFPARIFEGAAQRVNILIIQKDETNRLFTSSYLRWFQKERETLLTKIIYHKSNMKYELGWIPRVSHQIESTILNRISFDRLLGERFNKTFDSTIYFHRIVNNFIKAIDFMPFFKDAQGSIKHSDDFKVLKISESDKIVIIGILNSNIFYWYWRIHGDGFHCGMKDINRFPLDEKSILKLKETKLVDLVVLLLSDLSKNSIIQERNQEKTGKVLLQTFYVSKSKNIIDRIDKILADLWGLTENETDYIINFNLKFRVGADLDILNY